MAVVTYWCLESIHLEEIQALLLRRVAHLEMLGPHLDLAILQSRLLPNHSEIRRLETKSGRACEHDTLDAGNTLI